MASAPSTVCGTPPPPPPTPDDFYVPAYRLKLNGKTQSALVRDILSVTFHDSLKDVDSVEIQVNNWDPGEPIAGKAVQGEFRYHNTNTFDPWQGLELWMGYYRNGSADLRQMMTGEISSMAPNFPASGGSTLTVRALSFLHQFRIKQKALQFHDKTDSEIARQIVQDINKDVKSKIPNIAIQMLDDEITKNITDNKEKKWPFMEMHDQYPIVFLLQRARDIGYDISICDRTDKTSGMRNITFHYRLSSAVTRPTYTLVWGRSLISFQPTLQTARQVSSVVVNGWDVLGKKPISETVTRDKVSDKTQKMIAPEDLGLLDSNLAQKTEVVVNRGLKDRNEAKRLAESTFRQLAQNLVEAKGKTIGLPYLRAGSKVKICMNPRDIDENPHMDRFSGIYQVTESTHTFSDSGYTTDFTCHMESKK
jgi:phage protein D